MAITTYKPSGWLGNTIFALLIGIAVALMAFIPLSIVIFLIKDWGTAKSLTMYFSGGIGLVVAIGTFLSSKSTDYRLAQDRSNLLSFLECNNFKPHLDFSSKSGTVAVNDDYSKILIHPTGGLPKLLLPKDLLEIVLEINDQVTSVSKSGASGSIVGAAIGGVLTGGIGAVVGAVAGKNASTVTSSGVSSVIIKMVITGMPSPLFIMVFLEGAHAWERTSMVGKESLKRANEWWAILTVFKSNG